LNDLEWLFEVTYTREHNARCFIRNRGCWTR